MDAKITHYQDPQSRAARTQALLNFYKIPHQNELVDIRKGDHKKPEYGNIHPYRRVPAIRVGDTLVIESGAIQLHLADLFAREMNTPAPGTPERARLYEWVLFVQATLEPVAVKSFVPEQKEAAKAEIRSLFEAMSSRFVGPYALGSEPSVLDVILRAEFAWYELLGLFPTDLEPYASFLKTFQLNRE